MARIPDLQK